MKVFYPRGWHATYRQRTLHGGAYTKTFRVPRSAMSGKRGLAVVKLTLRKATKQTTRTLTFQLVR